jgi:ABC-type oligopeptide transport system substrate-binding subunit
MTITRTTRIRALALAAVCAASLGLAACGGDDDETTTPTTTDPAAADTTTTTDDTTDTGAVSGDIREQFDQIVRESLESAAAAGAPIDVDCAVDRLQQVLSNEDVQALIDASESGASPPSDIQQELANAGAECVDTSG